MKLPKSGHVLITPSGVSLRDVNVDNIIVLDLKGNTIEGEGKPSSEMHMHLGIYQERSDLGAIVHTHSPYAAGFSFSDEKILWFEGMGEIKKPYIREIEYATPGSSKLVELACQAVSNDDMVILKRHGALAVGPDLDEAVLIAEFIESSAETSFIIEVLGSKK